MTAAYRLKGVGWFGACTAVVLGFYLVSLQVAAERKKLEGLNASIASTRRDIRALETEFDTRANLAQLERWNGDTLALAAPRATQFVRDPAQFAAMDARQPLALGDAAVKTAALVVPSLSAPMTSPPVAVAAATPPQAPARTVAAPVRTAAAETRVSAPVRVAMVRETHPAARATLAHPAALSRAKPEVAMLDHKLLSDSTIGDLLARARGEKARGR